MNVCIYRIPLSNSIIHPKSRCPSCGYPIKFYDNIPIFSYLFLKGKCRNCKTHISIRYPIVELLTGLFAVSVFMKFHLTLTALIYFIFIATLITITFIDIDHQIIPDCISIPGIVLFMLSTFTIPDISFFESIIGIFLGGGSLLIVAWSYALLTGKEGMGGGDIKLLAMIGALIGWEGVLFTIFTGSAIGTLAGAIVMIKSRKNMKLAIPFGPFLSMGAIIYIFFGTYLIEAYLKFAIYI